MDKDGNYLFGPAPSRQSLAESFPGNKIPASVTVRRGAQGPVPRPTRSQGLHDAAAAGGAAHLGTSSRTTRACPGADISKARSTIQTGGPRRQPADRDDPVHGPGRQKFADITRELAAGRRAGRKLQHFTIILDGKIVSNPTVDFNDLPNGDRRAERRPDQRRLLARARPRRSPSRSTPAPCRST